MIEWLIDGPIDVFGWTLIHSLWQGFLISSLLWIVLMFLPRHRPQLRYLACSFSLLLLCVLFATTFGSGLRASSSILESASVQATLPVARPLESTAALNDESINTWVRDDRLEAAATKRSAYEMMIPALVAFWALGVIYLGTRSIRSLWILHQWKTEGREPEDSDWLVRFHQLAQQWSLKQKVFLLESAAAKIPMVVGIVKPAVLVPVGFLSSLPPSQVEAILLHELAHVRRFDFLANLLQNLVETFFFFHPAVWWIGRQLRNERECCCDQMAATCCREVSEYARALMALEVRSGESRLNVAANEGRLLERIRRLSGQPVARQSWSGMFVASILLVALFCYASSQIQPALAGHQETVKETTPPKLEQTPDVKMMGQDALLVRVVDADTGKPIPQFQLIGGVPIRKDMLAPQFVRKKGEVQLVNWQSHTLRIGKNGEYKWPMARMYHPFCLRVEASGYVPNQILGIDKKKGSQTILFRLHPDTGIPGQVLLPNGKPAGGAKIALGITRRSVQIGDGKFRQSISEKESLERWGRFPVVEADGKGRFLLPRETDPSAKIVAIHNQGVAIMDYDDFKNEGQVSLQRWARIECEVFVGNRAGAHEKVALAGELEKPIYPNSLSHWISKSSNKKGRVVFEKVIPGTASIQLQNYVPKYDSNRPFHDYNRPKTPKNAVKRVHTGAGQTLSLKIGGAGLKGEDIKQILKIQSDRSLLLDGQKIAQKDLTKLGFDADVTIEVDPKASYLFVIEIMDQLHGQGITDFGVGKNFDADAYDRALLLRKGKTGKSKDGG